MIFFFYYSKYLYRLTIQTQNKAMILGSHAKLKRLVLDRSFMLNQKTISFVKDFKYLGIILDNEMSLNPLIIA